MSTFLRAVACAAVMSALVVPVAAAASEPAVSTGNATAITSTSATLNGTVNPEGQATSYYFEYGTTTSYGSQTSTTSAGSGTADIRASAALASLSPSTTYHYRLVATNGPGTTLGGDVSFKTPKPPAPVVATGHAKAVTDTSATLTGSVNPNGRATDYYFQYGTTTAYGVQTPTSSAGAGSSAVSVSAAIGPLTPNTTYHCRLVATSAVGTTAGHDVSFTTGRPPGGVLLRASPSTITFGQVTGLSGQVLPPHPSGLTVTLQSAPSAGGPWTTAATATPGRTGDYSFAALAPSSNTYYRAVADGVGSAPVLVLVRFRITAFVRRRHPPAGRLVRFHGRVAPGHRGLRVLIQWLGPRGHWHTIRRTRLRGGGARFSFYRVQVPIERSGRYRVVVVADATHVAGQSRMVRIRVR